MCGILPYHDQLPETNDEGKKLLRLLLPVSLVAVMTLSGRLQIRCAMSDMIMNSLRLVIAGTSSGVGKTTITVGVIAALKKRGLRIQPFKCGPDYIDPSYLTLAAGTPARNLDSWMLSHDHILELFAHAMQGEDIAIVEGVMGLYDGRSGQDFEGSTAEIAKVLRSPVILIIDVAKMSGSAAAVALGYRHLDPELNLAGVILNNVATPHHLRWTKEAIESRVGVPVIGYIPKNTSLTLPERHLGLVPAVEERASQEWVEKTRGQIEATVDLDAILYLAKGAGPMPPVPQTGLFPKENRAEIIIAVARDKAFDFYYEDNLDLLSAWGGKLTYVSPLTDSALPTGTQGLYLGGGFPEMYAKELAANSGLKRAVVEAADSGIPIYAECGGLMYLSQSIIDFDGNKHPMVGLVPGEARMQKKLSRMGYTEAEVLRDSPLAHQGQKVRGHIFHWSELPTPQEGAAYRLPDSENALEGFLLGPRDNVLASYLHLHFGSDSSMAKRFVEVCGEGRD